MVEKGLKLNTGNRSTRYQWHELCCRYLGCRAWYHALLQTDGEQCFLIAEIHGGADECWDGPASSLGDLFAEQVLYSLGRETAQREFSFTTEDVECIPDTQLI